MKKSARVEREFGVPIPGEILDPSAWTKTALKKLPAEGPLDFTVLFGRTSPVIVDLGCGNGRFLMGSPLARPEVDHIGIDILPMVLRYATRRGNQRGLRNLRLAAIDAQTFLAKYIIPTSVREIHCYHPQPFHEFHDAHKRLIAPSFLAKAWAALEPAGMFFVQTDNAPYWQYMKSILPAFFDFHEQHEPWPDAPSGRTRREIIARRRGYPIYRGWGVARNDVSEEQSAALIQQLPSPHFDAGTRHKDLDQMERE